MIAQATRAVLFAKATAATSRGFRLSSEINQLRNPASIGKFFLRGSLAKGGNNGHYCGF